MIDQDKMRALAAKYRMLLDDLDIKSATKAFTGDGRTFADAKRAIEELIAELEAAAADKRDAERYRFLKRQARSDPKMNGQHVWYSIPMRNPNGGTLTGGTLDDAIDAALAQRQGEGS